ncbi:MAG TPA: DUF4239 domain-containing protein [Gaiellaceae bacterium]|nr:DUF4239 domain-containing protein [Gaiellaceae bacterium]
MDRWLLNTLPTPLLVLVVIGIAVVYAIGGFLLMRRLVPSLAEHAESRSLSSAFGMASGLFSFVLAFTIGQLYGNFTRATADAKQEATLVAQVLRTSEGLPGVNVTLKREALVYAGEVRSHEWGQMEHGRGTLQAWEDIDAMYKTLEAHRTGLASNPLYSQTLSRLNDLVLARRTRLDDSNLSLPPVFQVMLLLGAALALSTTFYFKPFGEGLQIGMIGAAAVLVGTAMLVALMLDYPYSGSITVSSAPFKASTLLLLSGLG